MCVKYKPEYFCDKIGENSKYHQKALFCLVNKLLYKKQESALQNHTNENQVADESADYCQEKIKTNKDTFQPSDYDYSYLPPFIPKLKKLKHTNEELKKIIMSSNSNCCLLNPIPTKVLKSCLDILLLTHGLCTCQQILLLVFGAYFNEASCSKSTTNDTYT